MYYADRAESQHKVVGAPDILYPPIPRRSVTRAEPEGDIQGHTRVWLILHIEYMDPKKLAIMQSTIAEKLQMQDKQMGADLITVELFGEPAGAAN